MVQAALGDTEAEGHGSRGGPDPGNPDHAF